jgi:hypothetical protein
MPAMQVTVAMSDQEFTTSIPATEPADPVASRELDQAIARLRHQFTAYEKLDRQIQEMIVRSADLLKGAVELRQRANQEIEQALHQVEEQVAAERLRHQQSLGSVVEDLASTRQRAIQLAGAISALQQQIGLITGRLEREEIKPAPAPAPAPVPFTRKPAEPASGGAETAPISMLILIQSVPDGTTALSLQRYVTQLDQVLRITSQEYAAGELRMQTLVSRPLTIDDFRGWTQAHIELAHTLPDALVLRLGSPS